MTRRFAKRAAKWNGIAVRCGGKPLDDARVQAAYAAHAARQASIRRANDRFAGCKPVTAVAKSLGMRRDDLFSWLQREDWLRRGEDGWRATGRALDGEWVVMRGAGAVSWPQITAVGFQELARRLGVSRDADSAA
ncbi:phage antirepressor KilAC domain-containing protein [Paraburkholderia ginsengisoli]|uniref:Phage antirepressor KilAC domain-containing protein n=2 Tax=Paraburkholderia ginsengisoli TaxID=311231 RepID=A0A7T4T8F7_9BURK|nr:phage antirepressor KilAC domain-containing protein [Paraburkholderia ginsengisoli]QQC63870.1 phage antirepressor KilAC domain-containing protein [Paraburkholderia ginsengisoli]